MFPLGDENPTRSVPLATALLIAVNVAVYLFFNARMDEAALDRFVLEWGFDAENPFSRQVFTSMFMHGGLLHLLGNMWMLWIVGNNVEDKLGRVRYVLLYLAGGVAAAWTYDLIALASESSPEFLEQFGRRFPPLVGASGAIAAMMGVYLIFFPEARIRVALILFLFVRVLPIRAKWFIGLSLLMDLLQSVMARGAAVGGVATMAHVGGGAFGILAALALKRRVGGGGEGDAWDVHTGFASRPHSKPLGAWTPHGPAVPPDARLVRSPMDEEAGLVEMEDALVDLVREGRVREAIDLYPAYEAMAREKPLPDDVQIEIAHELFRQGLARHAVAAYRRYLETHPDGDDVAEAKFRTGILLARSLNRPGEAAPWLQAASREHTDPEIVAYARAELARLGGGRG